MERDCLDLNFIIRLQARGEVVDLNIMIYTDAVGDRRKGTRARSEGENV